MNIQTAYNKSFSKAVKNDENVDSGMEDYMNWDFVEADVWMDLAKAKFNDADIQDIVTAQFDDSIDAYVAAQ